MSDHSMNDLSNPSGMQTSPPSPLPVSPASLAPEHYFRTVDGQQLKTIEELLVYIRTCIDGSYLHHVTADRHDFMNWVRDVFHETALADAMAHAVRRDALIKVLEQFVLHQGSTALENAPRSPALDNISQVHQYTDDELQQFTAFTTKTPPLDPEKRIELITVRIRELNGRVHKLRKQGKEPIIPDLLLRNASSKIDYFKITHADSDYDKIVSICDEAVREIDFCEHEVHVDIKSEIAASITGGITVNPPTE